MQQDEEITREEIKKEFQLERMILFSDAVFAIVITLMAIEIRLPETDAKLTVDILLHHLLPVLLAYMVSFIFIGAIWYQHLKIFGLLKDYDKGLVIRNLLLLFFVGIFPFGASLITKSKGDTIAFFVYLGTIMACIFAQYILHHYIVLKRPSLRINTDMKEHLFELRKRKVAVMTFSGVSICIVSSYLLIQDPDIKPLSSLWMFLFPVIYRGWIRKNSK